MKWTKAYFESMFEGYNSALGNAWGFNWRVSQKKRIEIALKMISSDLKRKGISVLEVGCATADVTKSILGLNRSIERYDALDISAEAIRICNRMGLNNVNFACASILEQDLPENYYDLILCMEVIYYFRGAEQKLCMEKMYRALKPGGCLLISVPYDEKEIYRLLNCKGNYTLQSIELNRNWLWSCIDMKLMRLYGSKIPKYLKGVIYSILSNGTLMNLTYRLCCLLKVEKYTHFYIAYRKSAKG